MTCSAMWYSHIGFNPRACVRRDSRIVCEQWHAGKFQSTRLREARHNATVTLDIVMTFQSTRLREARRH